MAASVDDAGAVCPNGIKTILANDVSTFFINGKEVIINGPRKLENHPSWLLIFLVFLFNKISLISMELMTFMKSFISLFVSVSPKPIIYFTTTPNGSSKRILSGKILESLECAISCSWVFYSLILAGDLFAKALQIFETCVLINNNLCKDHNHDHKSI